MKILFLTPWYPDAQSVNRGIFVQDQAVALAKQHEVTVIYSKIDKSVFGVFSSMSHVSEFAGVTEYRLVVKRSFPLFNQLNFFLVTIYYSWRIGKKFSPDIIHGNIGYPGAFWSYCISKLLGKPFVMTEHTRVTNNFRSFLHKRLTVPYLGSASAIICVSNHLADEVEKYIGRKPVVIPNIINVQKFKLRRRSDHETVRIGFLGSLNTPIKGLDILLQAMSTVESQFELHIGGDGDLRKQYEDLAVKLGIFNRCTFHGFIAHDRVPAFMGEIDFFVSASRYESFGMVIVEAMACGLPVVASDSGGPRDFVTTENGLTVPPGDSTALAQAIQVMAMCYKKYNPEVIRRRVEELYSAERFSDAIDVLYRSVTS